MGTIIGVIAITGIFCVVTVLLYTKRKHQIPDSRDIERVTFDTLLQEFKNEVAEITRDNSQVLVSDLNYEVIARNRKRIIDAIPDASYGIGSARAIVIALARNFLEKRFDTKEEMMEVVDLEDVNCMEPYYQWEILLYKLQKKYGKAVLRHLQDTYDIARLREIKTYEYKNGEEKVKNKFNIREFNAQMLNDIFKIEVIDNAYEDGTIMTFEECLDLFAVILFSRFGGYEIIDTLEHLTFDGMNFGTSGSIRYNIDGNYSVPYRTTNSIWIQIDAKWVLFSFLDFKTVKKQKKIINQLGSYGTAPTMTEKRPFKVTDGVDGSRRVLIRPGAGETWAYFQRNFTLSIYSIESLLNKRYVKNWELPATLIRFLMLAEETTAFTGSQNTGKTTLMKAAVEFMEDKNIRVLEMAFELALREIYPWKNIITVKPTDYVSSSQLQDLLKKSDGWVSMVGEVAEDIVAARMIQFCLVASAFTIFSHHGTDDFGLINGLTNSLVASGEYHDHNVAMSTVLDAVKNNVHLAFTHNKNRVVEYISQIVKENEVEPYPDMESYLVKARRILKYEGPYTEEECTLAKAMLEREYYTRTTDRVRLTTRKIVVFNEMTSEYEPNQWYTAEAFERIGRKLNPTDREDFFNFYRKWWVDWKRDRKAGLV